MTCLTKHIEKEKKVEEELAQRFANLVEAEKEMIDQHLRLLIKISLEENGGMVDKG